MRRLDRFEAGLLALLGALSLWVVASDLIVASSRHLVWTRTDGYYPDDQLQYLGWIVSASAHGLVTDMFVLRATPADYLQPAIDVSAGLVRLGVAPWLSLMVWKPVAVIAYFLAARALVDRVLERTFDRRAALVLAVGFCSVTVVDGRASLFDDMVGMWQSWGYPFGLIGVALLVWALIGYARARDAGTVTATPGLLGALAGLIHPWQGEMLVVILVLSEVARARETLRLRRDDPRTVTLLAVTLALALPALAYYFALGHLDPVWRVGQANARHTFVTLPAVLAAAPLLVFALLGYRRRPADFLELLVRMWIPATVLIWAFALTSLGATPQHAVNGLPIPMAVLAVLGVRRAGLDRMPSARALALAGIGLAVVPGTAFALADSHVHTNPTPGNPNFIRASESSALAVLHADRTSGGVLTSAYLGATVPGAARRQAYLGDCLWSQPDCQGRQRDVIALLSGEMRRARARRFVEGTGARFLLSPCGKDPAPVTAALGDLVAAERRTGCATVWTIRAPARP